MFDSLHLKLGRCLVRLQQYELLLQRILPYVSFTGKPTGLAAQLEQSGKSLESKTLGALVTMFAETCLSSQDSIGRTDEAWAELPSDCGSVRHQVQLVFDPERYEAIKADLKYLVNLRNDLVHHFVRRFNFNHIDDSAAADLYLDESYRSINAHYATLNGWVNSMADVQASLAFAVNSLAFENFIDGIGTDGSVDWARSGIVQALRDAEAELAVTGWVLLQSAILWVRQKAPEQTLRRYGCSSWRQVLHESKQFDILRKTPAEQSKSTSADTLMVWYRSRRLFSAD